MAKSPTTSASDKLTQRKKLRQNLILLTVSTLLTLIVVEVVLRWAIFSGGPAFNGVQKPELFTEEWNSDYWKLYYRLDSNQRPPRNPHPYLGWVGNFNRDSYYHIEGKQVGHRRPILLYGDSFSACIDSVKCFEDFLNADTAFTKSNFLLNYGVGGYGVCQASLLCRKTAPHFEKPLVIFGLLTTDLERTILPFRTGAKPYYALENDQLILKGLPIDSLSVNYIKEKPIAIRSYLLSMFLQSKFNFLPASITNWLSGKQAAIDNIQAVNRKLLQNLAAELRALQIDFRFLVFHFEDDMLLPETEKNWRDAFLKATFAENDIPFIWSKAIIRTHRQQHPENDHWKYIIPGEGHPSSLYNSLIAAEIKKIALDNPRSAAFAPDTNNTEFYATRIFLRQKAILSNESAVRPIREKAQLEGRSFELQLYMDANYLMNIELKSEKPFAADGVFEGKWRF